MSSPTPKLNLHSGLSIGYRQPIATVRDAIQLDQGTHFLIARNGRGKTTLLRTLAKTLRQMGGHFEANGRVQYLPEDLRFDPITTVSAIFRAMIPSKRVAEAMKLAESLELDARKPYGKLSTGNRRKAHLIMAELSIDP